MTRTDVDVDGLWARLPPYARLLYAISHPAMLFPLAFVGIGLFGGYSPAEITQARVPLFLQGSTDLGGSNIFAVTVALYAGFGISGAVFTILDRICSDKGRSYRSELGWVVWRLKFHIGLFIMFGISTWPGDLRIEPNDFRNMFLLAASLYTISIPFVTWLRRRDMLLALKVAVAPFVIFLWLIAGSDGNTAKAGQQLYSGHEPLWEARGTRHGLMLGWHRLCDRVLGGTMSYLVPSADQEH